MVASRNIQNLGQISKLGNVLEFIKKKALAKSNQKEHQPEDINESWVTDQNIHHHIEEVSEIEELIVCCKSIRISSKNKRQMIHPFLVGKFILMEKEFFKPIYVKKGKRSLYISQPVSDHPLLGYSWGVGHSPGAVWGYMSSSKNTACPDMAGPWQFWQKKRKGWTRDLTVTVTCGPEI